MKRIVVLLILFSNIQYAFGQKECVQCKADSLHVQLKLAKTDKDKIKVLLVLVEMNLIYGDSYNPGPNDLKLLIELGQKHKFKDFEAYQSWYESGKALEKKQYELSLNLFKESVFLFDLSNKKIPVLLSESRILYNELNQQEEKFEFYSKLLSLYLVKGPIENAGACYHAIGGYYNYKAEYNLAISNYLKAADIYKEFDNGYYLNELGVVAGVYGLWGNSDKALDYSNLLLHLAKVANDSFSISHAFRTLSEIANIKSDYIRAIHFTDSAILYNHGTSVLSHLSKAYAYLKMNQPDNAISYVNRAKKIRDSANLSIMGTYGSIEIDFTYFLYYKQLRNLKEAEKFLVQAYKKAVDAQANDLQLKYLQELITFYGKQHQYDKAYQYSSKVLSLTHVLDSASSPFKVAQYETERKELQQLDSLNSLKQKQAVQAVIIKQGSILLWISLAAIIIISASLSFVYRQFRINKRTLQTLQKTQQQLVLAEKMASLGELTAGIAHEIQNPLNFVNNFSELNNELIDEMKTEMASGKQQLAAEIADNIKQNLEKISHHGKRADAIVKGMLLHSRSSTGVKEATDINALADEYLRLAYHGLRAKDKSFNATMKTDFDETIGNISVVPQDIGRVILNLITNAFYTVTERKNQRVDDYEPTVSVSTKRLGDRILISVKDNGTGIPQHVIDKIFQPFFTTKPTGRGTGLGLSLSYDIVKAHDGDLKAATKEGNGSEFIIALPIV